jgi:hypothetical protein
MTGAKRIYCATLCRCPRGYLRMTRGRCDLLLLHRSGLSPPTLFAGFYRRTKYLDLCTFQKLRAFIGSPRACFPRGDFGEAFGTAIFALASASAASALWRMSATSAVCLEISARYSASMVALLAKSGDKRVLLRQRRNCRDSHGSRLRRTATRATTIRADQRRSGCAPKSAHARGLSRLDSRSLAPLKTPRFSA